MQADYFNDSGEDQEPQQGNTPAETEGEAQVAIIPNEALQGKRCKVGDKLTFDVTGVDEDSVEVKLAEAEHEDESPQEEASEMDSMMSDEGEGSAY